MAMTNEAIASGAEKRAANNAARVGLSPPYRHLAGMAVFLALVGFIAFMQHREIARAFAANPGLNGLILGVLAVGVILALAHVVKLTEAVRWANGWFKGETSESPALLATLAALERADPALSPPTQRAGLESIALRLDDNRETLRYLTGLLIFLGLLGTFWGLLETVGSIGEVIKAMKGGADSVLMFEDLKNGVAKPLAGMSLSFSASLFGLAASLVLGFLDLQLGQAQTRFYGELEDRLALASPALAAHMAPSHAAAAPANPAEAAAAIAHLAEGVQALVHHMRAEQQMIRKWVEAQADQNRQIKRALERLADEREKE